MTARTERYFLTIGILAALCLFVPASVFFGMFAGGIPGLLILAAPPLLFYSLIVRYMWLGTAGSETWQRMAMVGLAVAIPGVAIPWAINYPTRAAVDALIADDISVRQPVSLPDTIAIVQPQDSSPARREQLCSGLCQRLLYNGAVRHVVLGELAPGDSDVRRAKGFHAYSIRTGEPCRPAPIATNEAIWAGGLSDRNDRPHNRIKARVAAGECLVRTGEGLNDAGMILVDRPIKKAEGTGFAEPWNVFLDTVSARRLELLGPISEGAPVLDRITQVNAEPLMIPLIVSGVTADELKIKSGFVRRRIGINEYDWRASNKALREHYRRLFGAAVDLPAAVKDSPQDEPASAAYLRDLIERALDDTSDSPAGLDAFETYLRALEREGSAEEKDIAILTRAIRDPRVTRFSGLSGVVRKVESVAAALAEPLMDRLMSSPLPGRTEDVKAVADAIGAFPPGSAAPIAPRLAALLREPGRRGIAWPAIARLRDGGPAFVPDYVEALKTIRNVRSSGVQHESDALIGVLKGLCRMGADARGAEDALVEFVTSKRVGMSRSELAGVTLGRVAGMEKARSILGGEENWRQIERRIERTDRVDDACRY